MRGTWQGGGTWQTGGPDLGRLAPVALLFFIAYAATAAIAQVIVWLAVITGVLVTAAAVALVLLWRATRRREAAYEASAQHQRLIAGNARPQVSKGTQPPAIVNNYHVHHHYAEAPEAARVIRAIPGTAGDAIEGGK